MIEASPSVSMQIVYHSYFYHKSLFSQLAFFFFADVLGVVISSLAMKTITRNSRQSNVQKFVLLNEECAVFLSLFTLFYWSYRIFPIALKLFCPAFYANVRSQTVLLSLWDDFLNNEGRILLNNMHSYPVIIGRRLKVNNYNGLLTCFFFVL